MGCIVRKMEGLFFVMEAFRPFLFVGPSEEDAGPNCIAGGRATIAPIS